MEMTELRPPVINRRSGHRRRPLRTVTLSVTVVLIMVLLNGLPAILRDIREESRAAIRDAVLRSAVECYSVEGAYPADLAYLEEHYGLSVNHEDFIVSYEVFASNMMPDVRVLVRGEG